MGVIINPGSGPIGSGEGWENTFEQAQREASRWLERMTEDGLTDIELLPSDPNDCDEYGRWTFSFRHGITGRVVTLRTHGITDLAAYEKQHIFGARVYWKGSSCSNPDLDDWAAPGFVAVKTFRADRKRC